MKRGLTGCTARFALAGSRHARFAQFVRAPGATFAYLRRGNEPRHLGHNPLGLIARHVGGVIFTSLRQRENLVRAMLNGEKCAPLGDDVV